MLPKALFALVLQRLDGFGSDGNQSESQAKWERQRRLDSFLTYRCSKEFLALYIQKHPEVLKRAPEPGLMLEAHPAVSLAVRLHELELLPEEHRKSFVAKVNDYTFNGSDFYVRIPAKPITIPG